MGLSGSERLACLRKLPIGDISKNFVDLKKVKDKGYVPKLFPVMSWAAVIDGVNLKDVPLKVMRSQAYNKVPLIAGTNHDEGNLFTDVLVLGISNKTYMELLEHFFQPQVAGDFLLKKVVLSVCAYVQCSLCSFSKLNA